MTSTEIAVTSPSELKVYTNAGNMGAAASISASDVQIPSLILMQANSSQVEEMKHVSSGDFLHSINHEVWAGKESGPLDLVFLDMFKTQIWKDVSGKKPVWLKTVGWIDGPEGSDNDEYETEIDGVLTRREKCFNYVVFRALDVREIKSPTGEAGYVASPIVVKFKGGSLQNGRRLNNMFQDYADFGKPSWATTFKLKANFIEKDDNKYWAYDFEKGEQTLEAQQKAAENLFKIMSKARANNTLNVVDAEEQTGDVVKDVKKAVKNHAPTKEDLI